MTTKHFDQSREQQWDAFHSAYWTATRRAAGSHYTRSERLRREGALRRFRVALRRWRAECGCAGCINNHS